MGRNVSPTTKLAPQLVLVLIPEPKERTFNGNNSLCIQGTLPSPRAYAPTYTITLAKTSKGAVRFDNGISSCAETDEEGFSELRSAGMRMNRKPTAQKRSPHAMIGIDQSSMRLLPTRSINTRAAHVMRKLVKATDSEVNVGLEKPSIVKIVAEKYMREFCSH